MRFPIPYRRLRFRVDTPLSPFLQALREQIDEGEGPGPRQERPYRGSVGEKNFEINRINAYRSSYLPLIRGRFHHGPEGTSVEVTMRPHRQILIFSSIWFSFLLCSSLLIVLAASGGYPARLLLLAIPLGLALSSWLLTVSVFDSDCHWARKSLDDTLFLPLSSRGSSS